MVYMVITGEWALQRAGEWTEEGSPVLPFPRCSLPAFFPAPGPLLMGRIMHSPTISAPMNRLRRTLTSQNQRCRNRHGSGLGTVQPESPRHLGV